MSYHVDLSHLSNSMGRPIDRHSVYDRASSFSGSISPGWSPALAQQESMTDLSAQTSGLEFPVFSTYQTSPSTITITVEYPNSATMEISVPVEIPNGVQSSTRVLDLEELYIPSKDRDTMYSENTENSGRPLSIVSSQSVPAGGVILNDTRWTWYNQMFDVPVIEELGSRPSIVVTDGPESEVASLVDPSDTSSWSLAALWDSITGQIPSENSIAIHLPDDVAQSPQQLTKSQFAIPQPDTQTTENNERALVRSSSTNVWSEIISTLTDRWSQACSTIKEYLRQHASDSRLDYERLDPYAWDRGFQSRAVSNDPSDTLYSTENLPPAGHLSNGPQNALPMVRRKSLPEDRIYDVDDPPPTDHPESTQSSRMVFARI
ncbi:hypothetical protein V865_005675 [Kwoniella europaea PYCC6329]|uniref:Uncharacterized protein n=1 Tax=Kwoniella europaea PYCC6329 TaxID=1423913 RepID=A0AAX4KNP8_9TREE